MDVRPGIAIDRLVRAPPIAIASAAAGRVIVQHSRVSGVRDEESSTHPVLWHIPFCKREMRLARVARVELLVRLLELADARQQVPAAAPIIVVLEAAALTWHGHRTPRPLRVVPAKRLRHVPGQLHMSASTRFAS